LLFDSPISRSAIFVCGPIRRNSRGMLDFVIETHPAVGEIGTRQMQEQALPRPATRGPAL
jgi:hypothetical protein